MKDFNINHLAVWASVVALTVLGFLWYEPLFGGPWREMVGLTQAQIDANPPGVGVWITNIIATVIPMYVMAWLYGKLGVNSAVQGAGYGFLIAFAFVFLTRMTSDMFAQNPYGLSWIVGGFNTISLLIGGAIIGGWRKNPVA